MPIKILQNQIARVDPFTNLTKRGVFRFRLNALISSHNLNSFGKQFHARGPYTANACLPKVSYLNFSFRNMTVIWNIFSCDQAAIWLVQSVRLSVRLSVTPFSPCSHHHIIMKFSGVITNDKSNVHTKGQGQRSKVKVTEVNTQLNRFQTVTLVWIHIWWWNDAYSLMMLRRGALLFFKVIRQISRSHGSKKRQIWPRLGVSGL